MPPTRKARLFFLSADNIQDVSFLGCPVLRAFGLTKIEVETAGGGGAGRQGEMSMLGVLDADSFKRGILEQRQRLVEAKNRPPALATTTSTMPVALDEQLQLLRIVDYDLSRLPACRAFYGDRPAWNIQAHALFLPMNVRQSAGVHNNDASTSSTRVKKPAVFRVPAGATSVALWFHNNDRQGCSRYDSNFGENYTFTVSDRDVDDARAPDWMGNVTATLSRGGSRRCDGALAFGSSLAFGTWARQRAALTDLCFEVYEPGVTNVENPKLWRELDAQVEVRFGSAPPQTMHVPFVDRVGNNARYAVDLRAFDPFMWGRCTEGLVTETVVENGNAMVQATASVVVRVNGRALRPDGGAAYRVVYSDYANAPRVSCAP